MIEAAMAPQSTVVGVFDSYSTAETVAREITNAGIPRDAVEVRSNFKTGVAGRGETTEIDEEGGISGFFHRLFGGHEESGDYAEAVRRGSALVSATVPPAQVDQITRIMNNAGAIDIDRRVAAYRESGYQGHDASAPPYTDDEALREREQYENADKNRVIPVVEEELQVGKRVVRRGGVRVYSHVVEEPVEENIELREEHVRVDRRPADRPLEAADVARLKDQTIEVTEMAEEPVIQKRAKVREEVVVQKEAIQRTQQVRDNLRRTEVEVENLSRPPEGGVLPTSAASGYTADFRRDFESRYATSGITYEVLEPAYLYGYRSAGDPRYSNRGWSDVEEDLRTDYMRNYPNSKWDQVKGAIRFGWEKVTGKR
jgi:uncharacterized protein (TIGR02271 family)